MRHQSEIRNPRIEDCADGIVLDQLCWDFVISNPYIINTTRPITIRDGSNAVTVIHPALDTYTTGITIENGPSFDTVNNLIVGGHVQNGTDGIFDDGAYGTIINGTYFEGNTDADIEFDTSRRATVYSSQHYASTGASAIKARNSDGITVFDPLMTNGSRSTGLFDFDGTNANCHAFRVVTAGGINQPEGTVTGIGSIPAESSGAFTPVIAGSSAAGVGTYTTQSGTWRRTGGRVHAQIEVAWTAHTGTGNITITGIPTALTPTSFTPRRIGKVSPVNIAITGPHCYVFLNGTNTVLGLVESGTTGTEANVAMDAAGTLYINLDYDL